MRQSSSGTPSIWLTRVTMCMSSSTTKEPVGAFPACGHPLDVAAGGSGPIVWMHAGSVVLIGVGIAAALVFGDRRALLRSMRRLFGVDRRDTRWLRDGLRHPADRGQEPAGSPRLARRSRRVEREVVPGDPSAVGRRGLAPSGAAFNVHRPR